MICPSETVDAAGAGSTGIAITGSASKARVAMANRSFLILYLRHPPSRAAHAQKNSSGSSEAKKEPLSPWLSSQPEIATSTPAPVGERPLALRAQARTLLVATTYPVAYHVEYRPSRRIIR